MTDETTDKITGYLAIVTIIVALVTLTTILVFHNSEGEAIKNGIKEYCIENNYKEIETKENKICCKGIEKEICFSGFE